MDVMSVTLVFPSSSYYNSFETLIGISRGGATYHFTGADKIDWKLTGLHRLEESPYGITILPVPSTGIFSGATYFPYLLVPCYSVDAVFLQ